MSEIKVCIDRSDTFNNNLFGLYNSYKERESNIISENYKRIIGSDFLTEQILIDSKKQSNFDKLYYANNDSKKKLLELAMQTTKLWANGKKLKVKFLDGTTYLKNNVIQYAKQWEQFANIEFEFTSSSDAEIRVSFMTGQGYWSYIGTDALNIVDQSEPTMNFGWFDNTTSAIEFSRTVTHEFGHCLGCIHEHQSPAANINWNKKEVYDYYRNTQTPPWDKDTVDKNIFEKYTSGEISNNVFDPNSIMLYPILENFTIDGFSVGMNNTLSLHDKQFIANLYPKS